MTRLPVQGSERGVAERALDKAQEYLNRIAELEEERYRYREALERIASAIPKPGQTGNPMQRIAREALDG